MCIQAHTYINMPFTLNFEKTLKLYAYFPASRSWEAQGNVYSADGYEDTALR